jgi:hypothetical protein
MQENEKLLKLNQQLTTASQTQSEQMHRQHQQLSLQAAQIEQLSTTNKLQVHARHSQSGLMIGLDLAAGNRAFEEWAYDCSDSQSDASERSAQSVLPCVSLAASHLLRLTCCVSLATLLRLTCCLAASHYLLDLRRHNAKPSSLVLVH